MVADRPVIKPEGRGELVCIGRASAEFVEEAAPVRPSTGAEEEVPHQGAETGAHGAPRWTRPLLISRTPSSTGLGTSECREPLRGRAGNEETL